MARHETIKGLKILDFKYQDSTSCAWEAIKMGLDLIQEIQVEADFSDNLKDALKAATRHPSPTRKDKLAFGVFIGRAMQFAMSKGQSISQILSDREESHRLPDLINAYDLVHGNGGADYLNAVPPKSRNFYSPQI